MKKQIIRTYIWVTLLIISIGLIVNSLILFNKGSQTYLSWSIWGTIILSISINSSLYTHLYMFIIFDRKKYRKDQIEYLKNRRIYFLFLSNFLNLIICFLISCMYFTPSWWNELKNIKISIYSYIFLFSLVCLIDIYVSITIFKKYKKKLLIIKIK